MATNNTVNAKIKLRTSVPNTSFVLQTGEVYIKVETNRMSIYLGDGSTTVSGLKPTVLTLVDNDHYELNKMGGFTNNGDSLSDGTITNGSFSGTLDSISKLVLTGDMYGTSLPEEPTTGQVFFQISASE